LGLITGFLSRIAAFGVAVVMVVAVVRVHAVNGFFVNWFGNQKGEGFEFHLLAIGLALIVMIYGAGKLSLDAQLSRKAAKQTPVQSLSSTKREHLSQA
jgi:putative oxidoreductase